MIKVYEDADKGKALEMVGNISELTAECILIMREIYKRNLDYFSEPQVAAGILVNMVLKAADIGGITKQVQDFKEKYGGVINLDQEI